MESLCLPISHDDLVKTIDMMKSLYRRDGDTREEVRRGGKPTRGGRRRRQSGVPPRSALDNDRDLLACMDLTRSGRNAIRRDMLKICRISDGRTWRARGQTR